MNWKDTLQKKKGSVFLHAVARELLTDEWITTEKLHELSLELRTERGRPYKGTMGKSQLTNSLIKYGLAETTGGTTSSKNLIRRKQ